MRRHCGSLSPDSALDLRVVRIIRVEAPAMASVQFDPLFMFHAIQVMLKKLIRHTE